MSVWFLLLLTAGFYGLYNVLIKASAQQIHPLFGVLLLQIGAVICPLFAFIYLKSTGYRMTLATQSSALAILAGLFVGLAEISSFVVFSKGISATVGIPSIIGGSVIAGVLFSLLLLKEPVGMQELGGIALIVAGIALLNRK